MRTVRNPAHAPYINMGMKFTGDDESSVARKKAPIRVYPVRRWNRGPAYFSGPDMLNKKAVTKTPAKKEIDISADHPAKDKVDPPNNQTETEGGSYCTCILAHKEFANRIVGDH